MLSTYPQGRLLLLLNVLSTKGGEPQGFQSLDQTQSVLQYTVSVINPEEPNCLEALFLSCVYSNDSRIRLHDGSAQF